MSIDTLANHGDVSEKGNLDDLILDGYFTLAEVLRILETGDEITSMALDDERIQRIIQLEVVSALQRIVGGDGLTQKDRDKMNSKRVFEEAKFNAETQMRMKQEFESLAWNKDNDPREYTESYMRVIRELHARIPEVTFESPLSGNNGFLIQHIKDKKDRGFKHLFVSGEEIVFDEITGCFYMMRNGEIIRIDLNYIYYSTFGKNHPFGRGN